MDSSVLKKNIQRLVIQRNVILAFSVLLLFAVVLLSILFFFKTEKTIIIPTNGSSFWVEERRVSSGYLERVGLYLSDLLLNRSPADVDKKNQTILEFVHPGAYHEIRKQLSREKENILKDHQSFFFRTERSYVDIGKNAFVIEGEFVVLIGKEGEAPFCAQNERKKYILQFVCENGKLLLTSLKKTEI